MLMYNNLKMSYTEVKLYKWMHFSCTKPLLKKVTIFTYYIHEVEKIRFPEK
jgi:hypothetical protein